MRVLVMVRMVHRMTKLVFFSFLVSIMRFINNYI